MTRRVLLGVCALALVAAVRCGAPGAGRYSEDDAKQARTSIADLRIVDLQPGDGPAAARGRTVAVHYTGWLYHPDKPDNKGRQFDSSVERGRPFEFVLGRGAVIRGWDEGVEGMLTGGRRRLVIPPGKGYGAAGAGDAIPPEATLVFDVELIEVRP
jgi:FKBP-type peptidyl-prolyl cis-trans isomerase FkpA